MDKFSITMNKISKIINNKELLQNRIRICFVKVFTFFITLTLGVTICSLDTTSFGYMLFQFLVILCCTIWLFSFALANGYIIGTKRFYQRKYKEGEITKEEYKKFIKKR